MFYHYLRIDKETDVPRCELVSADTISEWEDRVANGPGPSLTNVIFDWLGGRKSRWNIVLVGLLTEKIMQEAESKWTFLPKYERFYWEESIWSKYRNLMHKWNRAQSRRMRNGVFETEEEASARLLATQTVERQLSRRRTRRHSVSTARGKYEMLIMI